MSRWGFLLLALATIPGWSAPPVQIKTAPLKSETAPSVAPVQTLEGMNSLGAQTVEQITSSGLLKLNGTKVTQMLRVSGSLLTQSARLHTVEVYGEANLSQTTVEQPSTIIGYLRAQNSQFLAPLTLGAQKAVFTSCKIASLTVRKEDAFKGKQIIELKQNSLIEGDVVFESGRGEVHLYPGTQLLGTVQGGKAIKKN